MSKNDIQLVGVILYRDIQKAYPKVHLYKAPRYTTIKQNDEVVVENYERTSEDAGPTTNGRVVGTFDAWKEMMDEVVPFAMELAGQDVLPKVKKKIEYVTCYYGDEQEEEEE